MLKATGSSNIRKTSSIILVMITRFQDLGERFWWLAIFITFQSDQHIQSDGFSTQTWTANTFLKDCGENTAYVK